MGFHPALGVGRGGLLDIAPRSGFLLCTRHGISWELLRSLPQRPRWLPSADDAKNCRQWLTGTLEGLQHPKDLTAGAAA